MSGYYDTYVEGLKDLTGMALQERRLQDTTQQRAFLQAIQAQRLQQGYEALDTRTRLAAENQRRLQETGDTRARLGEMGLRLREMQLENQRGQGSYDPIYGEDGRVTGGYDKRRNQVVPMPGSDPAATAAGSLVKPKQLEGSELKDLQTKSDLLQNAVRAMGLMRGETVEGQKGDPTATGWEGYVPDAAQTFVPGVTRMMGGRPGTATRRAIAALQIPLGHEFFGGAFTPSEMNRLRVYEPHEKDPEEVVRTKLGGYINEMTNMLENHMKQNVSGGRQVPVALRNLLAQRIAAARAVKLGTPVDAANRPSLDSIYGR